MQCAKCTQNHFKALPKLLTIPYIVFFSVFFPRISIDSAHAINESIKQKTKQFLINLVTINLLIVIKIAWDDGNDVIFSSILVLTFPFVLLSMAKPSITSFTCSVFIFRHSISSARLSMSVRTFPFDWIDQKSSNFKFSQCTNQTWSIILPLVIESLFVRISIYSLAFNFCRRSAIAALLLHQWRKK